MSRRLHATSNPAQRLYDILERHSEVAREAPGAGYVPTWAAVFDIERDAVAENVAEAFGLVGEINRALAATGDELQRASFDHHKDAWTRAFVPGSSGWNQQLADGVATRESRIALGTIASHLRSESPEGRLPNEEQRGTLRDLARQAIDAVLEDDTLDDRIAEVILRRLHDIVWALDHIAIKGPDGVAAACDRLIIAVVTAGADLPAEGSEADNDTHRTRRSLLDQVGRVAATANDFISAPGAWYGTTQAVATIAPQVAEVARQITGS